jgi:hypothetical protein
VSCSSSLEALGEKDLAKFCLDEKSRFIALRIPNAKQKWKTIKNAQRYFLQAIPFCRWIPLTICRAHKRKHTWVDAYSCTTCPRRYDEDGIHCMKRNGDYIQVVSKERGHLFISKDLIQKPSADKIRNLLDHGICD